MSSRTDFFIRGDTNQKKYPGIPAISVISKNSQLRHQFDPGRLRLRPIIQIIERIALRIAQHAQKPRAGFPGDPATPIEAPHGISASLVFPQDLGHELTSGQLGITRRYVLVSDVHPEFESLVHSDFHC
jgi:hypothetical protein